jgi:hypothetical protein
MMKSCEASANRGDDALILFVDDDEGRDRDKDSSQQTGGDLCARRDHCQMIDFVFKFSRKPYLYAPCIIFYQRMIAFSSHGLVAVAQR